MAGQRLTDRTALSGADFANDDLLLVFDLSANTTKKITRAELLTSISGVIPNGDKGDIVVSGSGSTWTIDAGVVSYAKIQDVSAQYRLLGRSSSGAGDVEEITSSANVFSILGAANYASVRTLLSLVPGTDVQSYSAILAAFAASSAAADKLPYYTGASTVGVTDFPAQARTFLSATTAAAQLAQLFPVGVIMPYAGSSAPTGWLLCYGQAVSRTTYSALFAIVGTTYGSGDGSTTFNVPDLRGRVAAGKDDMGGSAASRLTNSGTGNPGVNGTSLGAVGGVDRHTLTLAQLAAHTHGGATGAGGDHNHGGATGAGGDHNHGGATGSSGSHNHQDSEFVATAGASLPYDYQVSGMVYTAGNQEGSTSTDGAHTHTISSSGTHTHTISSSGTHTHTISSNGGDEAHPNVQPTIVLNQIIFAGA